MPDPDPKPADASPPGDLLFVGIPGPVLTPDVAGLLRSVRPGGVILFRRNVAGLRELAGLCAAIRGTISPPPLLAIDEEGGRVSRLGPHLPVLPAASLTSGAKPSLLRDYWRSYGRLLAAIGVDIDFAPVVDLCPPDAPNGIADRSYGTRPAAVIACASEAIAGLMEAGVLPTLKHFPGLGNTLLDSHHHLPTISKGRDLFEKEDLAPFVALAPASPAVMVGHGHYPFYSGPAPLAATLSTEVSTRLLRERVGFSGTAITDDLEMKAVAARIAWDDLAPRAIEAGNDMVLICHDESRMRAAARALSQRAGSDARFAGRCAEAGSRVARLREAAGEARRAAGLGRAPGDGEIREARAALLDAASVIRSARA